MEIAFDKDYGRLHDMQENIDIKSINPATKELYSEDDLEKLYLISFKDLIDGLSCDNNAEKVFCYTGLLFLLDFYPTELKSAIVNEMLNFK